jgi:tetratricopeptide (TPR) repeat protein
MTAAMAAVIVPVLVAVVAALYWSRRPINLPQVKHLAVLDFEATPEDIDLQQMADGLAEQVADTLAVMEQATHGSLWTVRRGLARDWGYSDPDLLRRTFNISLAVKGQVARNDQQIELTLEIADPITGHPLRSRTIQALPGNLSSLQHEPALALVELLTIEIDESTRELLTADTTNVMGVIEPFLRGRGILSWASTVEEIDTAVDLLETAAKADPLFDAPRLALARAHLRRFEFNKDEMEIDAGILNAEIVLSHERRVAEANLVLAGLHRAAGRAELAVTGIEKAIEVEPFNPELQLELAFTHQELGDNDRAEDAFNHAIYLRPGYWPDHYWLAVHYLGQGRYDGAAIQFRHVIQSAPEHIGGYNNLGAVYLFVGRREEAKQLFERSMAINSETNYVACSNLGTLYYWDSRFADAQAMFERAVAIDDSDYEVWGNLAQAYAAGHEPANAIEPFQRAIELAEAQLPGDAYLLTNLATYHASLGNDEAGLRYLDMAEEHGTTDPAVIANIAEAYEDLGHREQALEWVGRAVENGAEQSRFENRPSLRALVSDKRYRQLFADTND